MSETRIARMLEASGLRVLELDHVSVDEARASNAGLVAVATESSAHVEYRCCGRRLLTLWELVKDVADARGCSWYSPAYVCDGCGQLSAQPDAKLLGVELPHLGSFDDAMPLLKLKLAHQSGTGLPAYPYR
ncbi:MAG: hypothetical protein WC866_04720 [Patescibacteria group bacterium]